MVNVGIVGPGLCWETKYQPALKALSKRICVRAVYDAVRNRAEQAAAEFEADVAGGILALIERPDVQAVLVLDAAWYGHQPIRFACERHKPVYVTGCLGGETEALQQLSQQAASLGLTVMPELDHRYTPATNRLHELMATRLGKPHRILIEAVVPADCSSAAGASAAGASAAASSCSAAPQAVSLPTALLQPEGNRLLAALFDWCRYVVRKQPVSLRSAPWSEESTGQPAGCCVTLEFAAGKPEGRRPVAELRIRRSNGAQAAAANDPHAASAPAFRHRVFCEKGEAVVEGVSQISWSNGSDAQQECLTGDRSAVAVMLDHFCRRVVGGLIPVADINDLCHSLTLTRSAEISLHTGEPIRLS